MWRGWRRLRFILPLAVLVTVVAAALLAPYIAPFDPSAQQLARKTKLNRTTCYRLLQTLQHEGFVTFDEGSAFSYDVNHVKCKRGEYDLKLDKNFNVIIMLRD